MTSFDDIFRHEILIIFSNTSIFYSEEEIKEFINLLSEHEINHILQIIYQEITIFSKIIMGTIFHELLLKKIKDMQKEKKALKLEDSK